MVYATIHTPITLVTMLHRGELRGHGVIGVGGLDDWQVVLERVLARGHAMTEHVTSSGPISL